MGQGTIFGGALAKIDEVIVNQIMRKIIFFFQCFF